MADDIDPSQYYVVQIAEYHATKAEIERLRRTLQLVVDMLEEDFPKTAQQYAMDALRQAHRG